MKILFKFFGLILFLIVPGSGIALAATLIIRRTITPVLQIPCVPCPEESAQKKSFRFLKELNIFIERKILDETDGRPTQNVS